MERPSEAFPATRLSIVRALGSEDHGTRHRAHDALAKMYWKPVYTYVRLRWSAPRADAEDLTQDFFSQAFAQEWFRGFDASRARFRTFLRVCVDRSVMKAQRSAARTKRGGGATLVSMDFPAAEAELAQLAVGDVADPDELFRREWVRSVFATAIARLQSDLVATRKAVHFELFSRYDLHPLDTDTRPTYAELARALDLPATQVTNHLAFARRRFRDIVLALLAETTGDDRDYADSVRELLGVEGAS
jgi:RNA polymerase sigma factor (sigma-70 family)